MLLSESFFLAQLERMYEAVKTHEGAQVFLVLLDKCVSEKNKKANQKDKTQEAQTVSRAL